MCIYILLKCLRICCRKRIFFVLTLKIKQDNHLPSSNQGWVCIFSSSVIITRVITWSGTKRPFSRCCFAIKPISVCEWKKACKHLTKVFLMLLLHLNGIFSLFPPSPSLQCRQRTAYSEMKNKLPKFQRFIMQLLLNNHTSFPITN